MLKKSSPRATVYNWSSFLGKDFYSLGSATAKALSWTVAQFPSFQRCTPWILSEDDVGVQLDVHGIKYFQAV